MNLWISPPRTFRHFLRWLLALLGLVLSACSSPDDGNEVRFPSPAVTTVQPSEPVPQPSPVAPPRHYDVVITSRVSTEVENAALRAMTAWQQATVGFVTFTVHNRSERAPPCTASVVWIEEDSAPATDDEDDVAVHSFDGCHTIVMVNPWPDAEAFRAAYERLGVSPFVAVLSHELGHALGLPHEATTAHSVMGPYIQLAVEAVPTCLDVNALSLLRNVLVGCWEER